ncbi:TRAP transporter large permease [Pacificibacter marinus]|jgi:tripartite ATP-independent transporter DctM subunit|uniref:TRAP transporter large permease protein n=1 Tax=Pacificibacter marinus TaxID=658057 RepID=A0A1Y5TKG1_9RHOB|nr:TRAP transporter large permease [Pacificibacter marinus]SEL29427.1 TRAP transporter, DctM subunit [Pacificibacter marinus]SLN66366.1 Sialic acid TRAP transporter permease protein SiaT [Pacificibacter marinus]
MSLFVIVTFLVLAILGMPLAFSLGVSALAGLWMSGFDLAVLSPRLMNSVNSFPLMSIPLFMVAGELMLKGGIMDRLIGFANAFVGRMRGGLAQVAIISGAGLASVSGAAVADASALSSTLVPSLKKQYGLGFSSGIVAAAANLGPIIPPSGAMIVYAFMAGSSVSVGGLFMAGVVPGLILFVALMGLCWLIAWMRDYPLAGEPFSFANIIRESRRSFLVFLMPVIVIGGIVIGAFTPTEGAAIGVCYALFLGFFVTRQLKLSDLPDVLLTAAKTSALVGAMIAFASTVTFLFTIDMLPMQLATLMKGVTDSPFLFLCLISLMLLVVGMFLESNAAYIMLVPLFHPIALQYGIDPLHFGFIFVLNLVIGMLTPPVGVVLFVVTGITGVKMGELVRESWPFIAAMYAVLLLCMLVPSVVTWLPTQLGY